MKPSLLTTQSSVQSFLPNPYLHSSLHLHRPSSNFLRFISSNPQILPSIRCFSHSSKPFSSLHHQEPLNPNFVHEEPPPDQWKVEVQSPLVPASAVPPARLSLNDRAFFLLAFIACTVMGFPFFVQIDWKWFVSFDFCGVILCWVSVLRLVCGFSFFRSNFWWPISVLTCVDFCGVYQSCNCSCANAFCKLYFICTFQHLHARKIVMLPLRFKFSRSEWCVCARFDGGRECFALTVSISFLFVFRMETA